MGDPVEECSICLGTFKAPKGLPCFHTFCMECLQLYIDQDTTNQGFFSCPMCRAETKPYDSSKPRNEWAKLFPTNNFIRTEPLNTALAKMSIAASSKESTEYDSKLYDPVKTTVVADKPPVDTTPHPLQFRKSIDLSQNYLAGINDMVMLPDQCFLITEGCFKKVWKFSTDGENIQNLSFDTEPHGLCLLQNNLAAVSVPFSMKIVIFTTGDLTEKATISFQKKYYGLASDNDDRIFTLYRTDNICVDILFKRNRQSSYEISRVIKLATTLYFCHDYRLRVLPSGNMVIITPTTVLDVSCLDQSGTVTYSYREKSNNPLTSIDDIAIDGNFIYIADKIGNNIHRIRHQGNFVDIPLTSDNGILNPGKIFHDQRDVLAVLSKSNETKTYQIQLFSS